MIARRPLSISASLCRAMSGAFFSQSPMIRLTVGFSTSTMLCGTRPCDSLWTAIAASFSGVDQAEGLAVRAVEPVGEEADSVAILDLEVALVGTLDVLLGDITQILVNVHQYRHPASISTRRDQERVPATGTMIRLAVAGGSAEVDVSSLVVLGSVGGHEPNLTAEAPPSGEMPPALAQADARGGKRSLRSRRRALRVGRQHSYRTDGWSVDGGVGSPAEPCHSGQHNVIRPPASASDMPPSRVQPHGVVQSDAHGEGELNPEPHEERDVCASRQVARLPNDRQQIADANNKGDGASDGAADHPVPAAAAQLLRAAQNARRCGA